VVAVIVGYFLGGESIGLRTVFGTLLVLASVITISTMPAKSGARSTAELATAGVE
jgi:drug/metabolite transporter (DMT)-like permease